jgi:hypothetical protein
MKRHGVKTHKRVSTMRSKPTMNDTEGCSTYEKMKVLAVTSIRANRLHAISLRRQIDLLNALHYKPENALLTRIALASAHAQLRNVEGEIARLIGIHGDIDGT